MRETDMEYSTPYSSDNSAGADNASHTTQEYFLSYKNVLGYIREPTGFSMSF